MVRYDLNLFEVWKPIPGFENYEISSEGRVWSKKTNKILSVQDNGKGYKLVKLVSNKNRFLVHRLVCLLFIDNPDPEHLTEVNHINEDKGDNRSCNLEWCDRKYNLNYGRRKSKMIETRIRTGNIKYPNMTEKEKTYIRNKIYHNAHKEELKEKHRMYYKEHCEELKEKARINYYKNKK